MSARRPDDIAKLRQTIVAFFQRDLVEAELFLPWAAQQLRREIYASCQVLEEHSDSEGTFFRVRGEPNAVKNLREQFSQAR
jgi:GTPase